MLAPMCIKIGLNGGHIEFFKENYCYDFKFDCKIEFLDPKNPHSGILKQKKWLSKDYDIFSISTAAILKNGRQKFSSHFLEVHGGQNFCLNPKDNKTTKKRGFALRGHGSVVFDPTNIPQL